MDLVRRKWAVAAIMLIVAAVVRPQTDRPAVLPERLQTDVIIQKAEQVSAILDVLAARREIFLRTGSNIELFPMLYYHATLSEFRNLAKLPPAEAEIVLDMIIAFFDAYEHNRTLYDRRGARSVEKHWRAYYRRVTSNKPLPSGGFTTLLLDGVDAHLADLARTLRYTFTRTKLSETSLKSMYFGLDPLFDEVSKAAERDILAVRKDALIAFESNFRMGNAYVVHARHRAWEAAVGKGRLRAKRPQPIVPHHARSRTFIKMEAEGAPLTCTP